MTDLGFRQRFRRNNATAGELESVITDVLAELADPDSEASRAAARAGLDRSDLLDHRADVRDGEHGVEPFLTTLVIGIAVHVSAKVAESLWTDVVWPRIRRRLGDDALGEPVPEPADE